MTAAATLPCPSSRVLAGWWPLLARWQPRSLWLHRVFLHHLEAPVRLSNVPALDHLNHLLLEILAAAPDPGLSLERLTQQLSLDAAILSRLLDELRLAGLIRLESATWKLTGTGRDVLVGGRNACTRQERRHFYFAEGESSQPGQRFLPLDNPLSEPWPDGASIPLPAGLLTDCLGRSTGWKERHGFPSEVCGVVAPSSEWQSVTLRRSEQLLLLCVATTDEHLVGLTVQPSTWQLQHDRPVMRLGSSWREVLPELTVEPDQEAWRQAWRAWGQPRSLPVSELDACQLERADYRLRIRAPRPLVERLRATRSDAIKGEAWLLAGTSERTRSAALIELVEE